MTPFFAELKAINGKLIEPEMVTIHEVNIVTPSQTLIFYQRADGSLHTDELRSLVLYSLMPDGKMIIESDTPDESVVAPPFDMYKEGYDTKAGLKNH